MWILVLDPGRSKWWVGLGGSKWWILINPGKGSWWILLAHWCIQMVDPGRFQSWILVDHGSWLWILVVDPGEFM